MFSHSDLWQAIDRLAEINGLSTSALAIRAGLDPTALNKSKRVKRDGRKRWPSTESLSRLLEVTNTEFVLFARMVSAGSLAHAAPPVSYELTLRISGSSASVVGEVKICTDVA